MEEPSEEHLDVLEERAARMLQVLGPHSEALRETLEAIRSVYVSTTTFAEWSPEFYEDAIREKPDDFMTALLYSKCLDIADAEIRTGTYYPDAKIFDKVMKDLSEDLQELVQTERQSIGGRAQ